MTPPSAAVERDGDSSSRVVGIWAAVGAYGLWGVFALYWKLLAHVSPVEVLASRVMWSAVFTVLLTLALGRAGTIARVVRSARALRVMLLSTALIGTNWFLFIWAVDAHRVTEVSLGYYINPLLNVALGALVLKERLSRAQLIAVALAAMGVASFLVSLGYLPWVSLTLAATFAAYGLVRKLASVGPLEGIAIESSLLAPLGFAYVLSLETPGGHLAGLDATAALLVLGGPLTTLPLFLFMVAARRIPYSTLGMVQYLAPTLQLVCAVWAFDESFSSRHAVTFAFVWAGLAVYAAELVRRRPPAKR